MCESRLGQSPAANTSSKQHHQRGHGWLSTLLSHALTLNAAPLFLSACPQEKVPTSPDDIAALRSVKAVSSSEITRVSYQVCLGLGRIAVRVVVADVELWEPLDVYCGAALEQGSRGRPFMHVAGGRVSCVSCSVLAGGRGSAYFQRGELYHLPSSTHISSRGMHSSSGTMVIRQALWYGVDSFWRVVAFK